MDLIERIAAWNRTKALRACLFLTVLIAVCDQYVTRDVSLGVLYAIPLTISAVFLRRWQVFIWAATAGILTEEFRPSPWGVNAPLEFSLEFIAFAGVGLLVTEIVRSRRLQAESMQKLQQETALRQKVEEDARSLIESSPAAIITVGPDGRIDMTNQTAKRLLGLGSENASGQSIGDYFPVLGELMKSKRVGALVNTMVESSGRRRNGEIFFAQMWLSSNESAEGVRLAAVIADASEQLRDREEIGLRQLLMNSRIIAAAVSHEIRNLAAAASALHGNVGKSYGIADNEDFEALGGLIQALRKLSSTEVPASAEQVLTGVDVSALLRELRIIIDSEARDAGITLAWEIANDLPRVRADHSGLLQVLLNLIQNSLRALADHFGARIVVAAYALSDSVVVRVADNGPGIAATETLFQPFQAGATSAGLGLYVSRAIIRTYGGELQYLRQENESFFLIELRTAPLERYANA